MAVGITNLPQELIDLVAWYIARWEDDKWGSVVSVSDDWDIKTYDRTLLSAYATISRAWQSAIERNTFYKITLKSTELREFAQVLVNHRQKWLKRIEFEVVLPAYTDKACAKFETETDRQANNRVFTNAIKDLLVLLRSWHDESHEAGKHGNSRIGHSLCLCIKACFSPSDSSSPGWAQQRTKKPHDLFQHRYESSLLWLESIEDIQQIPQVTSFCTSLTKRNIEPRSLAVIASKFPNLDNLCWDFYDNEKRDPQFRQQTRFAFAEAFSMIPHTSLKRVALSLFNDPPNNEDLNSSSALISSCPQTDHLSLAIHAISQSENVTHLDLGFAIVISPSLFWPEPQLKPPFWPNLVSVKLDFSMNTANGDWYFVREANNVNVELSNEDREIQAGAIATEQNPDPDIPDTYNEKHFALATGQRPCRHYRSRADPDKLNPLFAAAAKAAAYMPRLRRMSLSTSVRGSMECMTSYRWPKRSMIFYFAMTYLAPGERGIGHATGWSSSDLPRLVWDVGPSGYEPEQSILELWRLAKGEVVQSVHNNRRHSWFSTEHQ